MLRRNHVDLVILNWSDVTKKSRGTPALVRFFDFPSVCCVQNYNLTKVDLILFAVPQIVDVDQELVAHGFVGRRHDLLHMHGEHVDDTVIQPYCAIFQVPVVFTGKVAGMIQQTVHVIGDFSEFFLTSSCSPKPCEIA